MYVFFFKQKTAYELRISDWSSDVCSSDLNGARSTRVTSQSPPASSIWCAAAQPAKPPPMIRAFFIATPGPCSERLPLAPPQLAVVDEIGRASCRDRVCQYV